MENKKMTKKEMFMELVAVIQGTGIEKEDLYLDFLNHEIELLDKKAASKSNMETTKQKENNAIMEKIFEALKNISRPVTISELQAEKTDFSELSNQKISALMKKLVDSEKIVRIMDKKKAYFMIKEN